MKSSFTDLVVVSPVLEHEALTLLRSSHRTVLTYKEFLRVPRATAKGWAVILDANGFLTDLLFRLLAAGHDV